MKFWIQEDFTSRYSEAIKVKAEVLDKGLNQMNWLQIDCQCAAV